MSERAGDMHTGGFLATVVMMTVTYLSGWTLELSGRLGEAWSHVTPGQAALAIGLLSYLTHNLPKLFRAAVALRARYGRSGHERRDEVA